MSVLCPRFTVTCVSPESQHFHQLGGHHSGEIECPANDPMHGMTEASRRAEEVNELRAFYGQ